MLLYKCQHHSEQQQQKKHSFTYCISKLNLNKFSGKLSINQKIKSKKIVTSQKFPLSTVLVNMHYNIYSIYYFAKGINFKPVLNSLLLYIQTQFINSQFNPILYSLLHLTLETVSAEFLIHDHGLNSWIVVNIFLTAWYQQLPQVIHPTYLSCVTMQ